MMSKTTEQWVKAARLENAAGIRFKRMGNFYCASLCFRMARSNMLAAREVMV